MKTFQTGDQNLVKKINKSVVLNAIEHKGPISRAQISKEEGLNKATVSTMVNELLENKLVYEIGPGQSSGGRKPVMLYFNNHAGHSIGIDLGVNYIRGVLTDLRGNHINEVTQPIDNIEVSSVIHQLNHVITSLINLTPPSPYGIIGIGIGIPGIVDSNGKILFAPNLKWNQVDLRKVVEDTFKIPVTIENEANAGAHGERLYGVGKDVENLVYISVGIGIGTGIIINNKLFKGSSGISGEWGHVTIDGHGNKCPCGNRGCWELYASESVLLEEANKLIKSESNHEINIEHIINEARNGNQEILDLLYRIGDNLGIGITNIINTFNPEMVIIGNRFSELENWIINPINRVLEDRLSVFHRQDSSIKFSGLKNYSCALGSSSFAISKFLSAQRVSVEY
ncbi:ROK family protein [Halobacillus shinanisalinarum]|uniref:ROK family protein n=1 Tax=Halobacillus shinanisalinarum TaxID=2932258 RepID=A0ABY4GUJ1_9BACI|nr:ROK family protein [Halobacillus shinanisalinarum]UOQ91826.1 ROK family protein [Halobacillus shinanisalinarum]